MAAGDPARHPQMQQHPDALLTDMENGKAGAQLGGFGETAAGDSSAVSITARAEATVAGLSAERPFA